MLKVLNSVLAISIIATSTMVLACDCECETECPQTKPTCEEDMSYYTSYYEDMPVVLRFRGYGVFTKRDLPDLTPVNSPSIRYKPFFKWGLGIEGAATSFYNNYLAAELSLGVGTYVMTGSAINAIQINNGTPGVAPLQLASRRVAIAAPIAITFQYHILPFGGIRPYIGLGYHYTILDSQIRPVNLSNGHGIVGQVGVDFVMRDDTYFNIDLKQYKSSCKVKLRPELLALPGGLSYATKVKINPLTISIGLGFRF